MVASKSLQKAPVNSSLSLPPGNSANLQSLVRSIFDWSFLEVLVHIYDAHATFVHIRKTFFFLDRHVNGSMKGCALCTQVVPNHYAIDGDA